MTEFLAWCTIQGICITGFTLVVAALACIASYQRRQTLTLEHCAQLYHGPCGGRK